MTSLLLIGGGGHCRSCIEVIESHDDYDIAGIILPDASNIEPVLGYPVVGVDEDLEKLVSKTPCALVTVGQIHSSKLRIRLFTALKQLNAELPVIIASTAYCSRHASVGFGTIVMHGALVNAAAYIGENCIINSHALIEHDVNIGPHCHIATGARINGGAQIGMGSFVGSGAIIREGITIGPRAVIGAGQVVMRNVPENTVLK
jgi:sugar O-acyltransferase (sialic acid O-acetyltransferase NeuD family)